MTHEKYDDDLLRSILQETKVIAMVGASKKQERASNIVLKFLLDKGYVVHPINPGHPGEEIYGKTIYASLSDVPATIDMVDVFRNSDAALEIARDAVEIGAKYLWMQQGVRNDEAARLAEDAGIIVIMNRCLKIEFDRLDNQSDA